MLKTILKLLKKIPVDFGQEAVAETTMGKELAKRKVPPVDGQGRKKALDVGCRKGVQSRWLRSRGYEVVSVDIDNTEYPDCLPLDVNSGLPFPDGSFDLIWCSEVLEHLLDPGAVVAEFRRVTRPGGRIVLTTPNSSFWLFRLLALLGLPPHSLQRDDHLHFFDMEDIRQLAGPAEITGFFPYFLLKFEIKRPFLVGFLSPTFVVRMDR